MCGPEPSPKGVRRARSRVLDLLDPCEPILAVAKGQASDADNAARLERRPERDGPQVHMSVSLPLRSRMLRCVTPDATDQVQLQNIVGRAGGSVELGLRDTDGPCDPDYDC